MRNDVIRKIVDLCRTLDEEEVSVIVGEITLLHGGFGPNRAASLRDAVPIDVPIRHSIDKVTGALYIQYPFAIGFERRIGEKEVLISPAGQVALAHILYESLSDETLLARIPPKPTSFQ